MDKFTMIYNIITDTWKIFSKHKKDNLENSLKPWEEMMSEMEQVRVKYKEYPRAFELFNTINLAILDYLDYTKD